jgi:hypothetical protein
MSNQFDEFLEEVEKDIRQDKFEKLWKQYGRMVITVVTAVLIAVAAYMLWQNHQEKRRRQLSEMFVQAYSYLDQGKNREALGLLDEISKSSHKYYVVMSRFAKAAHLTSLGKADDKKSATEIYEGIVKDSNVEEYLRDFAELRAIMLKIDGDHGKNKEALKKCLNDAERLVNSKNKVWRLLAMEAKAVILDMLNDPKAADIFIAIAQDQDAPKGLRQRAQMMSQALSAGSNNEANKAS